MTIEELGRAMNDIYGEGQWDWQDIPVITRKELRRLAPELYRALQEGKITAQEYLRILQESWMEEEAERMRQEEFVIREYEKRNSSDY